MQLLSCQNFRTEFVRQSQAQIVRKVTLTQFYAMLIGASLFLFVFSNVTWFAIPGVVLGYIAGYNHNGEYVYKRVMAYVYTWFRVALAKPRIVSLETEWQDVKSSERTGKGSLRGVTF